MPEEATRPPMIALDLFAGHGWGVACRQLGIEEYGVEIMPEACAVRELNGMTTIYNDVWEGLDGGAIFDEMVANPEARADGTPGSVLLDYDLLIASPPCQTFSMAGGGAGRKALDEVLAAIDARLYLDPAALVAFGETHDPKTALVLAPLAHIARDVPQYVVLEQVPPVLPVWERYAEEMRRWGYSVWTGNLQAEMYGVPQTRKRAILIARADGKEAKAPTPTHSRYYSRDPQRLDEGVLPWVSMAEALGWGMTERPMVTAGNAVGRAEGVGGSGAKAAIEREKSRGAWIAGRGEAQSSEGAGGPDPMMVGGSHGRKILSDARERGAWRFAGAGAAAERTSGQVPRDDDEPAHTITGKNTHAWVSNQNTSTTGERYERESDHPAPTMTAGSRSAKWKHGDSGEPINLDPKKPATTVAGDPRLTSREHHYHGEQNATSTRVTVAEAAILQSYPADFRWDATIVDPKTSRVKPITKTNTFLQIGNAVPPGLAAAILREVLS